MRSLRCRVANIPRTSVAALRCCALHIPQPRQLVSPRPLLPPGGSIRSRLLHSTGTVNPGIQASLGDSTIYALSTAPGRAAIAIVRVSGAACLDIYRALCPGKAPPKPRFAAFRSLHKPFDNADIIDAGALVLFFPGPKSVTGEDVLELQIHGGLAITKAVLSAIGQCSSTSQPIRYAEPGEFTRRAFLNNRLDLTQAEALGETLSAVTEEQRRVSVQSTGKALTTRYESWRQLLLYARGELEALIDFSEDQQFDESPVELAASVAVQIRSLTNRIEYYIANAVRGELLRSGISISLMGAPNVGKSSLLNLIVGRNAAIVSKEAGTTRDVVEVGIDLGGYFCRLGDTAGLRRSGLRSNSMHELDSSQALADVVGEIEQEGIRRAKERAKQSDLVVVLFSAEPSMDGQGAQLSLDSEVIETTNFLLAQGKAVVCVINKIDNYDTVASTMNAQLQHALSAVLPGLEVSKIFCISCKMAQDKSSNHSDTNLVDSDEKPTQCHHDGNLQGFLDGLQDTFRLMTSPLIPEGSNIARPDLDVSDTSMWQESLGVTQRQQSLLQECTGHLKQFLGQAEISPRCKLSSSDDPASEADQPDFDVVPAAESLRAAARCMSKITGRGEAGDVDNVLGVVFEK